MFGKDRITVDYMSILCMAAPSKVVFGNANEIGDHATAMLHQLGGVLRLSGQFR